MKISSILLRNKEVTQVSRHRLNISLLKMLCLILPATILLNLQVLAQTNRYVVPNDQGDDSGTCASASSPCSTIQYAINQAEAGDIIRVANGAYTERLTVNKSLSIIGENPEFYSLIQGFKTFEEALGTSSNLPVITVQGTTTKLTLENIALRHGASSGGAGIVFPAGGELDMTNGAIIFNKGAGIQTANNTVTLTNVSITNNQATNGAGILNTGGGSNALITLYDCLIENNTATNNGGGVYITSLGKLVARNTIIRNNTAVNGGGGIYALGTISFHDNTRFIENRAREGGAIRSVTTSQLTVTDAVFRENRAVNDPIVTSNRGGAIYHSGSSLNIFNTIFESNLSAHEGGAIYTDKGGNMADVQFIGNKATMYQSSSGGAIRMLNVNVSMSDVKFLENESVSGSAIAILQSTLTLDRGELRGNTSGSGTVHVVSGQLHSRNSLFTGNYSTISCGAALCLGNSATASLLNTTIASNYTTGSMTGSTGAIQSSQNGNLNITNSIIWQNYNASGLPQQVYTGREADVTFYNTLVEGGINGEAVVPGQDAVVVDMGGNLDGDPQFLLPITASNAPFTSGNYNVKPGSPARDSGLNSANNGHFDLARNARIIGGTIDMGAYEFTGSIKSVMFDFAEANVDVPFPDLNLKLRFAGVTEAAPVRLSMERFDGGLENAQFASGEEPVEIADARWVISKLEGEFSEATIGLTGADTLMIGLQPERLKIYKRSEPGIGLFEPQETTWDSELKILSTRVTSFSEFIIGDAGEAVSINEGRRDGIPMEYSLGQNYPNPFNPSTQIRFGLPEVSDVRIEIFDITGRRVAIAAEGSYQPGYHTVSFNAEALASGLYLYRMQTGKKSFMHKMILIK